MSDTKILFSIGSDASYDLIVEVLDCHAQANPIKIITYPAELRDEVEAYYSEIQEDILSIVVGVQNQFVVKIFNKIPAKFVWLGRIEAAVQELLNNYLEE